MSVPEKSELLENAYRQLSFAEGDLLSAAELPDMASLPHWLNKGDWLVLAHKVAQGFKIIAERKQEWTVLLVG